MLTQRGLEICLNSLGYEVCGMSADPVTAVEEIQSLKPDLVFLDINLNSEHDGIWVGEQLNMPFIYLTAYSDAKTIEHAAGSEPASYLIKPFEKAQVFAAITLALKNYEKSDENKENANQVNNHYNLKGELVIKEGSGHYKISLQDVLYIRAENRYIYVHTADRRFVLRTALSRFLEEYDVNLFHRVHKSYAINLNQIQSYSGGIITVGEDEIPLSRSYKKSFFDTMAVFKSA